jgi:hypothetical protein
LWNRRPTSIRSRIKKQKNTREHNHAAFGRVFMSTTSVLDGTRFDSRSLGYDTAAKRLFAKTATTATAIPLASAAVSALCIAIIPFVDYPWFAAAGLAASYGLFWISLSVEHARQ